MRIRSGSRCCPGGLRRSFLFPVITSGLLLALFLLPVRAAAQDSPYSVGLHAFSVPYAPTRSEIKGAVWYPTTQPPTDIELGPFSLRVARDGAIVSGQHPLAVISHGSRGSYLGHRDTALYLAGRGYVVVSLLHPRNNFLDNSDGRGPANWINRPRHVTAVLDWLLNESAYGASIDRERIGIIGHSAGGYTALAAAGGIPDLAAIGRHCSEHREDTVLCGRGGNLLSWLERLFPDGRGVELGDLHDERIRAVVLLAPLGVFFQDAASLSKVTAPVLLYRAEKDTILRYPYHAQAIAERLPVPPQYRVVHGAGHYSFLAPFTEAQKRTVGAPGRDPAGFDRAAFHERMNAEIQEFFEQSLPSR